MNLELENVCCGEFEKVRAVRGTAQCITEHPSFTNVVLNVDALQMRRHQLIERKLNYENLHLNPLPNNIWRKLAYGLFAMWINSWNNLGKGCRVVIPSCACDEDFGKVSSSR